MRQGHSDFDYSNRPKSGCQEGGGPIRTPTDPCQVLLYSALTAEQSR